MTNNLIAYCGLDCSKCDAYLATINNDDELRMKTATLWSKLNNVDIKPTDINCEGCKIDGKKTLFCDKLCPIRQCILKKKIDSCALCNEFESCSRICMITSNNQEALKRLQNIKKGL